MVPKRILSEKCFPIQVQAVITADYKFVFSSAGIAGSSYVNSGLHSIGFITKFKTVEHLVGMLQSLMTHIATI